MDAKYTWRDEEGTGGSTSGGRRDADGKVDFEFNMPALEMRPIVLTWQRLAPYYKMSLPKILDDSQRFLDAARG